MEWVIKKLHDVLGFQLAFLSFPFSTSLLQERMSVADRVCLRASCENRHSCTDGNSILPFTPPPPPPLPPGAPGAGARGRHSYFQSSSAPSTEGQQQTTLPPSVQQQPRPGHGASLHHAITFKLHTRPSPAFAFSFLPTRPLPTPSVPLYCWHFSRLFPEVLSAGIYCSLVSFARLVPCSIELRSTKSESSNRIGCNSVWKGGGGDTILPLTIAVPERTHAEAQAAGLFH